METLKTELQVRKAMGNKKGELERFEPIIALYAFTLFHHVWVAYETADGWQICEIRTGFAILTQVMIKDPNEAIREGLVLLHNKGEDAVHAAIQTAEKMVYK